MGTPLCGLNFFHESEVLSISRSCPEDELLTVICSALYCRIFKLWLPHKINVFPPLFNSRGPSDGADGGGESLLMFYQ